VRKLFAAILLAVGTTLCAQSELWEKATALSGLGSIMVAGTMTSVMEELNGDGSRKSVLETTMALSYDSSGKIEKTELLKAMRDGKDVMAEMKKNEARRSAHAGSNGGMGAFGFNGMFFSEDARKKTSLLPGAAWISKNGRKTASVPFEMGMGVMGKMRGTAEIDAESGIPSIVRTQASFPFMKALAFTMEYAPLPDGGFVLSRMEFDGTTSLILGNKRFHGIVELGNYRKVGSQSP
jgi:hypothetical protein